MDFAPTPPYAGTITHVVCQVGFSPKASPQPSVMGPNVDPELSPGLYKCEGKRNSTEDEDPSLYSVKFIYSGAHLNTCEGELYFSFVVLNWLSLCSVKITREIEADS